MREGRKLSKLAVASVVTTLVGVGLHVADVLNPWILCVLVGLCGLLLGMAGRWQIKASPEALCGRGLAMAGIVLACLWLTAYPLFEIESSAALNRARGTKSMVIAKATKQAIESFENEYGRFPDVPTFVETSSLEGVRLLRILLAQEEGSLQNERRICFLSVMEGGKWRGGLIYEPEGDKVVGMFDSYGYPFFIVLNPSATEPLSFDWGGKRVVLKGERVAVWSAGRDGKVGTKDDATTWR